MPIFEYRLPDGTVIEKIRSWKDREEPIPEAPSASLIPSMPHVRTSSGPTMKAHPVTGVPTKLNDYDDPWEGTKGEGWAAEASQEYCAKVEAQEVADVVVGGDTPGAPGVPVVSNHEVG